MAKRLPVVEKWTNVSCGDSLIRWLFIAVTLKPALFRIWRTWPTSDAVSAKSPAANTVDDEAAPGTGVKVNCVFANSNELRVTCEVAEVLVVADAVVLLLLALVEDDDEEVDEEEEEEVAAVDEEVVVDAGAPNWIKLLSVRVTAFAWGAEFVGFEVPGPLSSWKRV
jgi:hypothetical protein